MFIFNMQFLWKYIDDIIGKGLDLSIILELLFYQSLAMIPRAMVFGVLIASVMTMGNLAEKYELVTMKSVGISLMRVLRPLIFLCLLIAGISFIFSDTFIPITATKFKTVLHDIRSQKPALSFKEGQYNDDFKEISIYVGKKNKNGRELEQIKIYDHTNPKGYTGHIEAERAILYNKKDTTAATLDIKDEKGNITGQKDTTIIKSYLVIQLFDGIRYEELAPKPNEKNKYPHIKMKFDSYTTMYDMSEFEFNKSDESLFKGHHSLLSTSDLMSSIDSLYSMRKNRYILLKKNADAIFHFRREGIDTAVYDTIPLNQFAKSYVPNKEQLSRTNIPDTLAKSFLSYIPLDKRSYIIQRALGYSQNLKGQAKGISQYLTTSRKMHANFENEIHQKLSFAFACLLFLFIGAPMGTIIKKGGFGYPILVAFLFFMAFFILFLAGERLARNLSVPIWFGSWLPNIVLSPFAVLLTIKALFESTLTFPNPLKRITNRT